MDLCYSILKRFSERATAKFMAGQKEHGGDLSKVSLLELSLEAQNEVIDLVFYLWSSRERLRRVIALVGHLNGARSDLPEWAQRDVEELYRLTRGTESGRK